MVEVSLLVYNLPYMRLRKPTRNLIKANAFITSAAVWCGLYSEGIIASYFFENENDATITLNGDT